MKVKVHQDVAGIHSAIPCRVEWCNPQGVAFSFCDLDGDPIRQFTEFGFKVHESRSFPGVYVCPWESADGGDCYLSVLVD